MLILTVIQGPDKGRRWRLPDNEPQLIGRSGESLPLTDRNISRRHAELTPDEGKWLIHDLQSSNGTLVNGRRVEKPTLLHPGDQIKCGSTLFLFGQESLGKRAHGVRVAKAGEIDTVVEKTITANDESMIMAVPDANEAAALQLKVVYDMVQLTAQTADMEQLLEKVMHLITEYIRVDRGFVLLQEAQDQRPEPVVVWHRVKPKSKADQRITVSRTIVQHVLRHGEGVLSSNAMTDKRFASGESVQYYGIRSAMCVPIKFRQHLYGVIHVDSQVANYTYTEDQLRLLTAIGLQTGLALANAGMYVQRLNRERLAAVGQTVASLSHSIKNILQGMRGGADLVELGLKKENMKVVKGGWDIVSRNLERISNLMLNMLAYSKERRPELELTNLPNLLDEIVLLVQNQFDAKKAALITDCDPDMPPIPIDGTGIHQAVLNLLQNALEAVEPELGAVTLACEYHAEAQEVTIRVTDNGPGIPDEVRRQIFVPFYSTKGLRGTGLGLVVTKKIVEEHGGRVAVESKSGEGTSFTMWLPTKGTSASADTHGAG